jgi:pimeloyl-ACP methyl ester carboxylesterase
MASSTEYPKFETNIQYSDESALNTLDICFPRPLDWSDSTNLWIIYIHGGAWRDPCISSTSFTKTQSNLLASLINSKISGYASLNYRLSPYPSHPTDPSNPSDPARNARHPDHINDVLTGILYLQEAYGFEDRYILVGHSCGATLAFQAAMKRYWGTQYESTFALSLNVVPPLAIVGLEGLYDLPALVVNHSDQPVYRDFVTNAFGPSGWDSVSPTNADFDESWPDGKLAVLAYSKNDSLVEEGQWERMKEALEMQGWEHGKDGRKVSFFEVRGEHDEVWETGDASRAIEFAVKELLG